MEYVVVDIEFMGEPWEHDARLLLVGVKPEGEQGKTYTYGELLQDDNAWDLLSSDVPKVVFTKADHRWLGLGPGIIMGGPVIDVQVMAWAVNELTELSLDGCVQRYVGKTMDKRISRVGGTLYFTTDAGERVLLQDAPLDELRAYCVRDLDGTEELFLKLTEGLDYDALRTYWLEECVPLSAVLVRMELNGLPVDLPAVREMREELEEELADLEEELTLGTGLPPDFNLNSNDHLAAFLYEDTFQLRGTLPLTKDERAALKLGDLSGLPEGFQLGKVGLKYAHGLYELDGLHLPKQRYTDTGKPSTDAKTLTVYYGNEPWVAKLLAYKKKTTVVGFLRSFEERAVPVEYGHRIYGRFNQTGTKTGRLSSSGPNLQNVPARGDLGKRVRSLFRAEPGMVFVHGDYSQLEPRLMAHFSQDPLLLDIFRNGRDIYMETAQAVFGEALQAGDPKRDLMKTYVLAMGYGAGASKLQELLAIAGFRVSLREVEATLAKLKQVYATYFAWREATIGDAEEYRFVETLAGHRRRLARPHADASWKELGHGERAMANAVVQGSAADIVARTMVRVDQELPQLRLLAQVHDELLWEADATPELWAHQEDRLRRVQDIAEAGHGFQLSVPLSFKPRVVETWAEGKE